MKKLGKNHFEALGRLFYDDLCEAELSETEVFKTLANNLQVGICILQNKQFQFVNLHMQEYTGYSEAEMLVMDPLEHSPSHRQKNGS